MTVNVFITHKAGSSSPFWRNVPIETAKRICSTPETAGDHFMLVWSKNDHIGIYNEKPIVDDGRFDHLLTDDERKIIHCWDGKNWRPKS